MWSMARAPRIEFEGAVYHVTARGNERRRVYRSDEDRRLFLETLEQMRVRFGIILHCFCLMPNHFHLVLETPRGIGGAALEQEGRAEQETSEADVSLTPGHKFRLKAMNLEEYVRCQGSTRTSRPRFLPKQQQRPPLSGRLFWRRNALRAAGSNRTEIRSERSSGTHAKNIILIRTGPDRA
jgi:hypothetical protein